MNKPQTTPTTLEPINENAVKQTAQVLLSVLDDERFSCPGNLVEGVTSGKSLLRGIIGGNVIVCERRPVTMKPKAPTSPPEDDGPHAAPEENE